MLGAVQFENFRYIWDTVDIAIVALGIYYLLKIIERTRTAQILMGLIFLLFLYMVSRYGELYTVSWILSHFLGSIIIIAVVLFQQDIRRALAGFGRHPFPFRPSVDRSSEAVVYEVVKAASFMASRKIGAIIAIERSIKLSDYVEIGMKLDARVSRELIITIFLPTSPLHDGGMIIGEDKVLSVGSFFPLVTDPDLERELGTRHRAALGLSRETDAIVVVVSEETGIISLAYQGNLTRGFDATSLENRLMEILEIKREMEGNFGFFSRLFLPRKKSEEKGVSEDTRL